MSNMSRDRPSRLRVHAQTAISRCEHPVTISPPLVYACCSSLTLRRNDGEHPRHG
jgi:hypothetical protein